MPIKSYLGKPLGGQLDPPEGLTLMRLRLIQKSRAALELLLFIVTVKLPSYTSRASAKDLLNFHSLIFSPSNIGGIFDKQPFRKPVQLNVQQ